MRRLSSVLVLLIAVCALILAQNRRDQSSENGAQVYANSMGIEMVRIPAGTFAMGNSLATDPGKLGQFEMLTHGDYDEQPVHRVTISHPFYISQTEVTAGQYQEFRMDYQEAGRFAPYVTGISWYDAEAFCKWLSEKEHRTYRLPTEAEWEYVARAGGDKLFGSSDTLPASGEPNAFGVENMNTDALEWVADWYGPYSSEAQVDPVGPADGIARVVRGGGIMGPNGLVDRHQLNGLAPYYRRSANRASVAPQYKGLHMIGFRVVEGPMPATKPTPVQPRLWSEFVKQTDVPALDGPTSARPWFHIRSILTIPPDNALPDAIQAAGLDRGILGHIHAPGVIVCPNGDLLYIAFAAPTPETEYLPNVLLIATRLRFGSDEWDIPDVFYDFADVNDQTALLWNDKGTLQLFTGGVGLEGVPFRWQQSKDNGATWSKISFPLLVGPVGGFSPQPITNAFRTSDGTMYVSSDAVGGHSLLWGSHDNGKTWYDTGGRSAGRHTAFVVLKDGSSILALGGKNTNIDGYMPAVISHDGGKHWGEPFKTPFPALSSNQRPTMIRLADGNLFVASDWQDHKGKQPAGIDQHGVLVALSSDDGKTWHIRTLPQTLPHEAALYRNRANWSRYFDDYGTIGYSVARQGANGLIHLISSMTQPSLEFEMNESWIMSDDQRPTKVEGTGAATKLLRGAQSYPDGKLQATWTGTIDSNGRYLLHGPETWYYANGKKQYEVTYKDGKKVGTEISWDNGGNKIWEWQHQENGSATWRQYWPDGKVKHESHWRGGQAHGLATAWDSSGQVVGKWQFTNGALQTPMAGVAP
ncbi:MAG TPA: SUMF1/EgtB/PvdO family nonheme iron enzyme [Terriglobales bacterium]|nr:SUMF1/EgtB/PvdO family nonheme iron enzyme [Terriglobales bacterium]